jgi:hypothetical protein
VKAPSKPQKGDTTYFAYRGEDTNQWQDIGVTNAIVDEPHNELSSYGPHDYGLTSQNNSHPAPGDSGGGNFTVDCKLFGTNAGYPASNRPPNFYWAYQIK